MKKPVKINSSSSRKKRNNLILSMISRNEKIGLIVARKVSGLADKDMITPNK